MIKGFIFEDFKGFQKTKLYIDFFTTLIGTNASGKSNAIEAIAILSEIVSGKELASVLDGTRNSEGFVRGGSKACCRFKSTKFSLGCLVSCNENEDLLYKIRITVSSRIWVDEERLTLVQKDSFEHRGTTIFCTKSDTDKMGGGIKVSYRNGKKGTNPDITVIRDTSVISQMKNMIADDNEVIQENVKFASMVINDLKNILVLTPDTNAMGRYNRISDSTLKHDCSNLSAALYEMCKDDNKKSKLLEIIQKLPENEIKNIGFLTPGNGDVLLYLEEKYMNSFGKVYANQLSAGTLRSLAVIAAMLCESEGSMVIIDEVDNGIHPSRARALKEWLVRLGTEQGIDIVITTHNRTLLDSVTGDEVDGVSVVYRNSDTGASEIIRFTELSNYTSLLAMGGIGRASEKDKLLGSLKETEEFKLLEWMGVK